MPIGYRIAFVICSYLHFLCSCFIRGFFLHMVLLKKIKQIYLILIGATTPDQCAFESNGNERLIDTPHSFRTGASPSDAVNVKPKTSLFFVWEDTVSVF